MKKILTALTLVLFTGTTFAQDETKGFRFGLRIDPMLSWYKPDNEKKFENLGTGLGFGWGLHLEFKIAETFSFYSTFGLQYDKGKLSYFPQGSTTADSVFYRIDGNDEFVEWQSASINGNGSKDTASTLLMLNERVFSVNYANIGFGLKMKTKEIGYLTYFGHFGGNIGIKTKAKANDQVYFYGKDLNTTPSSGEKSALDITSELQPLKIGLTIGAGAEYNISGSTSLLFGLTYNHGVTNVLKKNSDFLRTIKDGTSNIESITQQATVRNITLTIGILF